MKLATNGTSSYGSSRSRKDFTHQQLVAMLVLRLHMRTTYRGLIQLLAGHRHIREALDLTSKLPHFTTLQKFAVRTSGGPSTVDLLPRVIEDARPKST